MLLNNVDLRLRVTQFAEGAFEAVMGTEMRSFAMNTIVRVSLSSSGTLDLEVV